MTNLSTDMILLNALEFATLEQSGGEAWVAAGDAPGWLAQLTGVKANSVRADTVMAASPFLASFLTEAEEHLDRSEETLQSGSWTQRDTTGQETAYEAWALRARERCFVAIRRIPDFEERRAVYQKARELALSHESLGRRHRELGEEKEVLEQRTREVERLNDLKTEFLASMSHELKTPLNAILGFSNLLEEEKAGPLTLRQRDYLQHIGRASNHLLTLINDILDLSRIEAGHLELAQEALPFWETLNDVLTTVRPLARAKNINFVVGSGVDQSVYADRLRLRQVLYNLLSNAIKFTPDFGEVAVDCRAEDDAAVIVITDNGIGVPAEEQQAIFEKFHQAAQTVGLRREGTGLGLAISRQLVERHGGRIWVESEAGGLTRFSVRLPGPQ